MTTVFDQSAALAGTDDTDSNANFNFRVVIQPSALSAASGNQCQLTFLWGTAEPSEPGQVTSVYFGQSGGTPPNFTGDQVQVKFGGNSGFDGSAAGVVTSDIFTLPQNWDSSKSYTVAWHFVNSGSAHQAKAAVSGVEHYFLFGADVASQTAPGGWTDAGGTCSLIEKIAITAAGVTLSGGSRVVPM